mgnify:FL=1
MNNLMIFEGKQVEVFEFEGKVLFNPYHVGECLDLGESAVRMAIKKMNQNQVVKLKNPDVKDIDIRKLNNAGENFLTESGVYKLIFKSHKEEAERFQDWVTDEVLPTIRKHGAYLTEDTLAKAIENPDFTIGLLTNLKEEREKRKLLEAKVEADKPKVIFAEAVDAAQTSILVGDLAKLLKQNGVNTGQKRLFEWLRTNGYLISRKGNDYNSPTQKSMELGLFEIKERTINNPDGSIRITKTPKVTGKGQVYFINKFLKDKAC